MPPNSNPSINHPPPLPSYPPINRNNNAVSMVSLTQMKQSNGCASVRKVYTFNLQLIAT